MDRFFKIWLWIAILAGSYVLSYFGTRFVHNRVLDGDEQVEYVVSTQFEMYNPEFIVLETYDDGTETRLYEGVLNGRSGYVLVVKDIDRKYSYSFMLRSYRDIYARNAMYIEGSSYIPLHRQYYHHTTLIILYTYHDNNLQYYYTPNYYRDEETIVAESTEVGNWSTFLHPQSEIYFNYFSILSLFYIVGELSKEVLYKIRKRQKAKVRRADIGN